MAWWAVALQGAQTGYGIYAQGKQNREQMRAARDQQRRDNAELMRLIKAEPENEIRPASERRLMLGGAGVRGGSATGASLDLFAGQESMKRQEDLARQLDFSLQDKRTEMDPLTNAWRSYYENVWKKPGQQVADEAKRVGKRVEKEWKRIKRRLGF